MKQVIVVLDFESGEVHKIKLKRSEDLNLQNEEYEQILSNIGYNLNNVEWIVTEESKIFI